MSASSSSLIIEIDPGDTTTQARALYKSVASEDVTALLAEKRWSGRPGFHLMYMTSGFFRPRGTQTLAEYWTFWRGNPQWIRQWKRADFDSAFTQLLTAGVVQKEDRPAFNHGATATKRGHVDFAPGAQIRWTIPLGEAEELDERGKLVAEVETAIRRGATALGLKLPW